jgi:hypothetical protein
MAKSSRRSSYLINVLLVVAVAVLAILLIKRFKGGCSAGSSEGYRPGLVNFQPGDEAQALMLPSVPIWSPDGNLARPLLAHEEALEIANHFGRMNLRRNDAGSRHYAMGGFANSGDGLDGLHAVTGNRVPNGVRNPYRGDHPMGVAARNGVPPGTTPVGVLQNSDGSAKPVILPATHPALSHEQVMIPPFPGAPYTGTPYGPSFVAHPPGPGGSPPVSTGDGYLASVVDFIGR